MTRFDPNIEVKRLVVQRDSRSVYDEHFHSGLNIIRGDNSSGKSTILNFLFYGLGGELGSWSDHALLCDTVYIEVLLNGRPATLRRTISASRGQGMDIAGGAIFDVHDEASWARYPYQRSASKESFSQVLFRLLEMPEVSDEVSSNVTMHQILRLLYSDQLSPTESLFRFEQFDPPSLREAVGNLLCGVFQPGLYENQLRIKEFDKEYGIVDGKLRSLYQVLGQIEGDMSLMWIDERLRALEAQRERLNVEIAESEAALFSTEGAGPSTLEAQKNAFANLKEVQAKLAALNEARTRLTLTIEDAKEFVYDLQRRLEALSQAGTAAEFVGNIEFRWCPSCFAPIEESSGHTCHLCKAPFGDEAARDRLVNLINSTATQIKQSELLQRQRTRDLAALNSSIEVETSRWKESAARYDALRSTPSSKEASRLKELQRQLGYTQREIEDTQEKQRMATIVRELSEQKASLAEQLDLLRTENEGFRSLQEQRRFVAYTAISEEVKVLLENDLKRQDSFEHPGRVWFDFANNRIGVDEQSYFSASSRAYLRTSFYAGFLAAACKIPYFRHPRFCIIDTIEDKGMEQERSHNFQRQLARLSSKAPSQHQIIVATAMIAPELDTPDYTIGKTSTRASPSLAFL